MPRLWSELHLLRSSLSHDAGSRRRQRLSFLWDKIRHAHTLSIVPKSSSSLRGFALGIGSSAAAFAVASYGRADPWALKPFIGRSAALEFDEGQNTAVLALTSALPAGVVTTDQTQLQGCSYKGLAAVVRARNTEDVVKVVNIADEYGVPLITQYASESVDYDIPGAILVDLSSMNRILHIHDDDGDIVCQAATPWEEINCMLKENDISLKLPFDARNNATVGTIIGTGAVETDSKWLLNVTAVLPNGKVLKTQRRARRAAAGLNTTALFVGTEGTLGIVTEVTLRLVPLTTTQLAVAQFEDVSSALSAAMEILKSPNGSHIRWIKFIDDNAISNFNSTVQRTVHSQPLLARNTLLFMFEGSEPDLGKIKATSSTLVQKYSSGKSSLKFPSDDVVELWNSAVQLVQSFGSTHVRETNISVPVSHLSTILDQAQQYSAKANLTTAFVGHVKDGNFRSIICYDDDTDVCEVNDAVVGLVHRVLAVDGSCTGENGVGPDTKDYLIEELGYDTVQLMRTIKAAVDPHNILNPHKSIFPTTE